MNNQFWCSREKYQTHTAKSKNVHTRKAQAKKSKKKKRDGKRIPAEKEYQKQNKKTERQKSGANPPHDDP